MIEINFSFTEVISKQGSVAPQRPISLLKVVIALLKTSEQLLLTIYYFLVDFFIHWDDYSFIELVNCCLLLLFYVCLQFLEGQICFNEGLSFT